jgi:hypothetical protein
MNNVGVTWVPQGPEVWDRDASRERTDADL